MNQNKTLAQRNLRHQKFLEDPVDKDNIEKARKGWRAYYQHNTDKIPKYEGWRDAIITIGGVIGGAIGGAIGAVVGELLFPVIGAETGAAIGAAVIGAVASTVTILIMQVCGNTLLQNKCIKRAIQKCSLENPHIFRTQGLAYYQRYCRIAPEHLVDNMKLLQAANNNQPFDDNALKTNIDFLKNLQDPQAAAGYVQALQTQLKNVPKNKRKAVSPDCDSLERILEDKNKIPHQKIASLITYLDNSSHKGLDLFVTAIQANLNYRSDNARIIDSRKEHKVTSSPQLELLNPTTCYAKTNPSVQDKRHGLNKSVKTPPFNLTSHQRVGFFPAPAPSRVQEPEKQSALRAARS